MEDIRKLIGRRARGKLARWKFPVDEGVVVCVRDAFMGNVRVQLADGSTALMLYPPLEVLEPRGK